MTNLHIHSITLYNFKSFKGLHTIQPLDPFFNVIAGSNGSGKSNIIDSILFVLGYTAKSLRHKIITDVIYQNETQLDTCYVEILFRHTEDLVIRRELKNKKSTYTINNKIVNPAEINTILKTYNIDNSRFLILQGEIESISMMKPKNGMLNYLEEIIGTNKYENEIAMLTDEYEKMNTMYDSKTTNFKFYEKEFNMLKNENEENINNLNKHIERMRAKLEIDDYKKQLCGMENKRYTKELKTTTQLLKDLENKNMASKKEMSKCEEKLATKRTELGKADSDLQKNRKVYIGIDTQNALYEDKKGKLEKNIEKLNTEINNRENENKQKERERELITKELEEKQVSIKEMTKEANLHKKEIEKNESKKLKLLEYKKLKNLEKEFLGHNSKKTEIENKIYEYSEKTKALETLKVQKASYKENKGKEDELAKLTKNQNKVREEINSIDKKLTHKQSELQREMYKLNDFTKNESANKKSIKLNSLLKPVEGFIGRLGDLGSAKEELDIAISTAGKGILNYVVVKDTETAEKCIDILKRNNIERTSFIACDKISDYKLKGNFDYLINHIECEERYKKLFYFAISDTILCKDINEATRIAMGKEARKAVTLDGNMIEKSGLMSGGGAVSGGMKIQNDKKCATEKIIQKLEIEVRSLTEEKERLIAKLNALSVEIADLSNQVKFIDIKLVDQKIKKVESELKTVKIKELESGLQKLNDKIDNMKKEMTEAETYLESLDSMQIKQLKGDVSILFEKILLYENRIAELNRKLANLKLQDIKHFESLILECKKEIKQLKKPENYEKCKEEIKKLESSRNKIVEEVNEMSVTIKEIRSKIGADFDKEIEYRNCIDEINECIVKNKKSIEQIDKERKLFAEEVKSYVSIGEIKKIEKVENIEDFDILKETILRLEQKHANVLKSSNNQFNINAMRDFVNKNKEFSLFKKDYNSFVDELTKRKEKIDSVTKQRLDEFTAGLQTINKHLKEIYQLITFGGNAELESVDTLDPFSEGIILSVMPPKKSWKNVNMLSGGEKTLSSLALVFALHAYKPSCFYVMDEIDAALDNRNVSVIANYIYEKAKNAQFLIVSLRNNMFELSETIVGVFKNNGLSQTLLFDTKNIKMDVN